MRFFVMVKTVLISLLRKPATVRYPFVKRPAYKNTRGSIAIEIDTCIFCGMCQRKCPTKALTVTRADTQWEIDRLRCVTCGYCVIVCPKKCLRMENQYSGPVTEKVKESFKHA